MPTLLTLKTGKQGYAGLDEETTAQAMMDGIRIYYNFLRPHTALNGKTPAEKAEIGLRLASNKWLSLIQRSLEHSN
jgi:hypothetical protein